MCFLRFDLTIMYNCETRRLVLCVNFKELALAGSGCAILSSLPSPPIVNVHLRPSQHLSSQLLS